MSKDNQRRGPLSAEEKEYILKNAPTRNVDSIAKDLLRNPKSIRKYIVDNDIHSQDVHIVDEDEAKIIRSLHKTDWWSSTLSQLEDKEIALFESLWARMYKQFDYDVLPTEGLQLRKYITLEIMKDRALARLKNNEKLLREIEEDYQAELEKAPNDRDRELVRSYREQISNAKNATPTYNKEFQELCKEQSNVEKGLSGSRDQRIKTIQDATKNWSNILRLLEDPAVRKKQGQYIEIMRQAFKKEMNRLTNLHTYVDGEIDTPILSGKLEEYYESGD